MRSRIETRTSSRACAQRKSRGSAQNETSVFSSARDHSSLNVSQVRGAQKEAHSGCCRTCTHTHARRRLRFRWSGFESACRLIVGPTRKVSYPPLAMFPAEIQKAGQQPLMRLSTHGPRRVSVLPECLRVSGFTGDFKRFLLPFELGTAHYFGALREALILQTQIRSSALGLAIGFTAGDCYGHLSPVRHTPTMVQGSRRSDLIARIHAPVVGA